MIADVSGRQGEVTMNPKRAVVVLTVALLVPPAIAQQPAATGPASVKQSAIIGVPSDPTDEWTLAYGGRLYDTWWQVLGEPAPTTTNPAYPAAGRATGAATWGCRGCHSYDYKGVDGVNATGTGFTGVKGVLGALGRDPAMIAALLRASPHNYTAAMIPDDALVGLATFISRGTYNIDTYVDPTTKKVRGDVEHGRAVFQTFCAACHGLDGRAINFAAPAAAGAPPATPDYVGNRSTRQPEVGLHKLMNGLVNVPDREKVPPMASFRVIGAQAAVDALAYAQTLPQQ
jgi:mono/diheme cytochrome c family protein